MLRFLSYILVFLWLPVSAQIIVTPLQFNTIQAENAAKHVRMKTAAVDNDTIQIPFVEDFVNSNITPNDSLWMPGGGTFINNTYPINQTNYNVATFDGLNAQGVPYYKSLGGTIYSVGKTDSLISRPINIGPDSVKSPVYFRFFWEAGGRGDIPDQPSDSLTVQFKTISGNWITVKNIVNIPETNDSSFSNFELIPITDPQYLYNGFQFRFQSYGKQSGNYDVWNIDYIRVDTGVIANVNWAPEFAYRSTSPSLLKTYTSMPIKQYEADIKGETRDQLEFEIVNLREGGFSYEINTSKSFLVEEIADDTIQHFPNFTDYATAHFDGRQTRIFKYTVDKSNIDSNGLAKKFEYRSTVKQGVDPKVGSLFDFNGVNNSQVSNYNYTTNDTIKGFTLIRDYYSYDDGTAEGGIGVSQKLGRIAAKYHLNVKDTLESVSICFPDISKDFKGTSITIIVWTDIVSGQGVETVKGYNTYPLQHGSGLNGFYKFKLNPAIVLDANTDFFVGYQQTVNELVQCGFDRNIDNRNKIYFKVGNIWQQYNTEYGSIMIRPYFHSSVVTSNSQPQEKTVLEATVYPNPTQGEIVVEGKIKSATVYDISGRQVYTTTFEDEDIFEAHPMNLSNLSNGLYLIHLENSKSKVVKKIYINK